MKLAYLEVLWIVKPEDDDSFDRAYSYQPPFDKLPHIPELRCDLHSSCLRAFKEPFCFLFPKLTQDFSVDLELFPKLKRELVAYGLFGLAK